METFIEAVVQGILVGGIYALVALGWVIIYKCSGVLNLAMGELTIIGAYVALSFYTALSGNPAMLAAVGVGGVFILSVILTLVVGAVLGYTTERLFLDKLIGEPILAVIMVTVGISFFLKGTVQFIWGTDTRVFNPPVFSLDNIKIGFLNITPVYMWSFILSIILLILLVVFFKYTRWGLSMQATADDETAALSLGVSARFVYAASWAIAFMAAGVGGALLGNINGINTSVSHLGLLVLPAVVLGGLNSIPGAIVGGITIGILQNLAGTYLDQYFPGGVKEITPFVFMAVFLLFKPYGLWGWERIERV